MNRNFIVTHANPDQDAVSSIWLIKRFWSGWEQAEVLFVPAGETLESFREKDPKSHSSINISQSTIVHVDTGFGEFDHHQTNDDTCAAKIVYEQSIQGNAGGAFEYDGNTYAIRKANYDVLDRMVSMINDIDHFREVYYPEANNDRYQFLLSAILDGLNLLYNSSGAGNQQVVSFGMTALDGIYRLLQNKVGGEREIDNNTGTEFDTRFGKAVGFETSNDAVLDLMQKNGYAITARKDPRKGYVRIKSLPEKGIDLEPVYEALKKKDPTATWFLHASHAMLLNGSTKNPTMKPSTLSIHEIMDVIREQMA